MTSFDLSPLIAKLLLAFSLIAFLASIRAIANTEFRNTLLRNSRYLKEGTRITLASAMLSASWWAVVSIFLTLIVFHIRSAQLRSFLGPMAGCLILAWVFTSYFEYRRRKRSN